MLIKNCCDRVPAEAGYRLNLATHQAQLGLQYQNSGRVVEAQRLGFDGLASLDRLQHDYPERSDPQISTRMRHARRRGMHPGRESAVR